MGDAECSHAAATIPFLPLPLSFQFPITDDDDFTPSVSSLTLSLISETKQRWWLLEDGEWWKRGEHNGDICARNWKSRGENTSEDDKCKKKENIKCRETTDERILRMDVGEPASSDSPSHNPTALYMNLLWRKGGGALSLISSPYLSLLSYLIDKHPKILLPVNHTAVLRGQTFLKRSIGTAFVSQLRLQK